MRHYLRAAVLGVGMSLAVIAGGTVAAGASTSGNLVINPGAEMGPGSSDGSVVAVPGWTETTGTTFTAVQYGAPGGFPSATSPGPTKRGANFFAGGPNGDSVVAVQTIDLSKFRAAIKAGKASFNLRGYLGGFGSQEDSAFIELDFKNGKGSLIGTSATLGPVTAEQRQDVTGFLQKSTSGGVPKGAHSAFLQLALSRVGGGYNDGYADNLSFTVTSR
jgi:hypothetical protein